MQIKVKTPAKINLGLEVLGIREDGFHNIASIMQTISLYDYLTFTITPSDSLEIVLSGERQDIPYDKNNIIYKAIDLFYTSVSGLTPCKINVGIEKNIPVQAGLGGGSSNAAGALWALNKLLNTNLPENKMDELCARLGSDVNVCYHGGTCYAESRGEKVTRINSVYKSGVSVIKPLNFGITARDGYLMFDTLNLPSKEPAKVFELKKALTAGVDITDLIYNDLEIVPLKKFDILKTIKKAYPSAMMTGSGSAFFILDAAPQINLPENRYQIFTGLEFTGTGVCEA